MHKPVFSIITPTFNRPYFLKQAVLSICRQTYGDYEHIVIDDGQNKENRLLLEKINDKRVKYYRNTCQQGPGGARNMGIKMSTGRYLLFLDDDDEYHPEFLNKVYHHFFYLGDDIGFIWTGVKKILKSAYKNKTLCTKIWPHKFPSIGYGLSEATSIGIGYGVCVRRACIKKIGLFDESMKLGEDTDFMFRLAKNYKFRTIPEVLVTIYQHSDNQLTGYKKAHERIKAKEIIFSRYKEFITQHPEICVMHYKNYADLCYKIQLKRKGRKAMFLIIKNTSFKLMNVLDFLSYEFFNRSFGYFYQRLRFW